MGHAGLGLIAEAGDTAVTDDALGIGDAPSNRETLGNGDTVMYAETVMRAGIDFDIIAVVA
jgi:hypothetical protein